MLVLIVLAASGAFSTKNGGPTYALSPQQMARLASGGHSTGSPDAPVTILEFSDFQCPFCKTFWAGPLAQIKKEFVETGQARFAYRHMAFIGPESILAAEASECAAELGQFFPYHDLLFRNQAPENTGYFTHERFAAFAQQVGVNTEQFSGCLSSRKYQSKVAQSTDEALALGVRRTPTVFVNGRAVENALDVQAVRSLILEELKRGP